MNIATKNGQTIPNGMLEDNYPRNMWWVAAHKDEVSTNPWHVGFGNARGAVPSRRWDACCLYDRCPHRWAPLSEGHVSGDKIVCPYHGMEFNNRGVCTKAPTQHMKPKTAEIPSYAVREVGAYIWIWMGDQDAIDTDPPEVGYQVDPDWSPVNGYYEVAANWVLIRENVLDLTHIAFLHKNTFKQDDWIVAPDVYMEGETICYEQEFDLAPCRPCSVRGWACPKISPLSAFKKGGCQALRFRFLIGRSMIQTQTQVRDLISSCAVATS